jgi:hypothetical protein
MNKFDRVVFRRLANSQIYSCGCFTEDEFVGSMTDVGGVYLHGIKKFFEDNYPGIRIDIV